MPVGLAICYQYLEIASTIRVNSKRCFERRRRRHFADGVHAEHTTVCQVLRTPGL